MKRDMDMVRDILFAVEAKDGPEAVRMKELFVADHPDSSERRKHIISMTQAGFFDCEPTRSKTNPDRIYDTLIFDLSWQGHEYLDAIRDPKVWKQTKIGVGKIGGASFEFFIEIAKSIARNGLRNAGISLGI